MFNPEIPLKEAEAKALVRKILDTGDVRWPEHALEEMEKDAMTSKDVENTLRGGWVRGPEWENGEYRYHLETQKFRVVVAFESETELVVVTAMRFGR